MVSSFLHEYITAAKVALERERDAAVADVASLRKEMVEISDRVGQLELGCLAAPAPITSSSNSGPALSAGRDINLNSNANTLNIYPILPWSATEVDFAPLSSTLNNYMAQAFSTSTPVESLMSMRMKHEPPQHYSAYIMADDVDSIRFFDGRAYRRVEDPKRELDRFYDTCHAGLDTHSTDPKNRFDLDFWCDERNTTYEMQRELLAGATRAKERYEDICNRLKSYAPAILEEIKKHGLEVEQ